MKVKCIKCNIEEELTEEEIKELSHMALKYNNDAKPDDYTAILSIIKGKCKDGKKHLYTFHESFDKIIDELIGKYTEISSNKSKYTDEINKTIDNINRLSKELEDSKKRQDDLSKYIEDTGIDIEDAKKQLEKLTGTINFDMWK